VTAAPSWRRVAVCRSCEIALLGIVANLVVLISTPFLRPDLNLFRQSLSYYAIGPWGTIQAAAFVALSISSLALAFALWQSGIASPWVRLAIVSVVVAGISSLGLVVYPMSATGPATILGDTHQTAGTVGAVAELVATLALILAIRAEPSWSHAVGIAFLAFLVALGGAVLSQVAIWWPQLGIPMGATMRVFVIPLILLWGVIAWRLRQRCAERISRSCVSM
jgi:uncharacterized protein DUF998